MIFDVGFYSPAWRDYIPSYKWITIGAKSKEAAIELFIAEYGREPNEVKNFIPDIGSYDELERI